jgi:aspartyl-tRNA(Asn)/glutamyl-tRNA(Gln) amidotransferase subunit C
MRDSQQGKAAAAKRDSLEFISLCRREIRSILKDTSRNDEALTGLMLRAHMTERTSQNSTQTVSEEQVLQVAALANLELTPEELPAMGRDLNAILGYIAQLNELDVANVAPMAQVSEIVAGPDAAETDAEGTPLREDTPVPCLERAPVMQAAPETDGAFFKVPQVIGR